MSTTAKLWVAGLLAFTLFVLGSPVITNGNLIFEAYDPPSYYGATVSEVVAEAVLDYDSYNIGEEDAFYFLPYHGNSPTDVFDLQVFDYNSDGNFIYAYVAYFYGDAAIAAAKAETIVSNGSDTGLTVKQTGTATPMGTKSNDMRTATISQEYGGATDVVVTIMSYNPYTYAYTVFLTELFELDSVTVKLTAEESGLDNDLIVTTDVNSISGNKLMDVERYFVCVGTTGYLFEKNGTLMSEADYYSSAYNELYNKSVKLTDKEIEILDVVMDGSGYTYVAITLTDITTDDNVEDVSEDTTVGEYLLGYYYVPLNTDPSYTSSDDRDSSIVFRSINTAQDAQEKAWMSIDGATYTSWSELNNARFETYSAANIMDGTFNEEIADTWEPFHWGNFVLRDFPFDEYTVGSAVNTTLKNYNYTTSFEDYWWLNSARDIYHTWSYNGWRYIDWGLSWTSLSYWAANFLEGLSDTYDSWAEVYIAYNGTTDALSYVTPTYGDATILMVEAASSSDTSTGARLIPIIVTSDEEKNILGSWTDHYRTVGADAASLYMTYTPTVYSDELTRTVYYEQTTYNSDGEASKKTTPYTDTFPSRAVEYSVDWPETGDTDPSTNTNADSNLTYTLSWMTMSATSSYALPSPELGAYYYSVYKEADAEKGTSAVSYISYNDGDETRVSDNTIPGSVREARLFYTDKTEILTVLTDEGVQYYSRAINGESVNNYTKGSFITLDAFTPNSSNYFVTDQSVYTEYSGEAATLDGLDRFTLLNDTEMIVASQTDGLVLHNLSSDIFFSLDDGCYYQSFPVSGDEGEFMVIGYDTTDYSYDDTDLVWAKCYSKDIGKSGEAVREEFVISYAENLANLYWQYTHLIGVKDDGTLYVQSASDEQKAVITRAYNLFFGEASDMASELKTIAAQCGQSTVTDNITEAVTAIRTEMQVRALAVKALFENVDIVRTVLDTQQVALLNLEYEMLYAPYEYRLENILIEAYLRQLYGLNNDYDGLCDAISAAQTNGTAIPDAALKFITTLQSQFALYYDNAVVDYDQNDYVGRDTTFADLAESSDQGKYLYLIMGLEALLDADSTTSDEMVSISYGSAYVDMLALLGSKLVDAGTEVDWSTYLTNMLFAVNPYNAVADATEAASELCSLVGIDESQVEEVLELLCDIYDIVDLERLIVEYNITKATYVGSDMATDWENHLKNTYSTTREKEAAFYAGSFYAIVTQYEAAYDNYNEDSKTISWESKLTTLLRSCSGLVLS